MGESRRARAAERAALTLGLELGLLHIDTAELYGDGGAEELIGEVLRGGDRSRIFLTSKVLPQNASYRGTIAAAERSLQRLRTDYLDLYLLHWPGRHPIEETMRAMEELVTAGKIRFIGVSNFDVDELAAAMHALTRHRIASNQVLYNLATRGIERDLIPFCERSGIAVVGYTPFGNWPRAGSKGLRVLTEIGARHERTPRQVALRFLTRGRSLFAIPKAVDAAHLRENAGSVGFELDDADRAAIEHAFPVPRDAVPLATA
jgi:diketogulonate reductase-like aldo/keto reductase